MKRGFDDKNKVNTLLDERKNERCDDKSPLVSLLRNNDKIPFICRGTRGIKSMNILRKCKT